MHLSRGRRVTCKVYTAVRRAIPEVGPPKPRAIPTVVVCTTCCCCRKYVDAHREPSWTVPSLFLARMSRGRREAAGPLIWCASESCWSSRDKVTREVREVDVKIRVTLARRVETRIISYHKEPVYYCFVVRIYGGDLLFCRSGTWRTHQ